MSHWGEVLCIGNMTAINIRCTQQAQCLSLGSLGAGINALLKVSLTN